MPSALDERSILLEAMKIANPLERRSYLDRACQGDSILRERIESQLDSNSANGGESRVAVSLVSDLHALETVASDSMSGASGSGSRAFEMESAPPPPLGLADPAAFTRPLGSERYLVLAEVGTGGMGVVYRATDVALGREVAIKVLHARYLATSTAARRFADEARITGQLQHPGIPPVHDLGTLPDGRPFLAMKLIEGRTLAELLKERDSASADRGRLLAVFEQACNAIACAHAKDVIHRDIKPANIMVGAFGEVQVMDWGLAKHLGDRSVEITDASDIELTQYSDDSYTQAGAILGTPAFMSPEQALGETVAIDKRSDVFGLGAVLCVILTGTPPFKGNSVEATRVVAAKGKLQDCFARLDSCGADPDVVALCKQCLAPDPVNRPADAGVIAREIAELRQAAEERARRAELERVRADGERAAAEVRAAEQRKRRRTQAALGMTFTTLVVVAGGFAWWINDQQRARQLAAEREVRSAIGSAEMRYAEAKGAERDLALWAEARMAAATAAERACGVSPELQAQAQQLLSQIEQEGRNRRLLTSLLDVQASMGDQLTITGDQDFPGADERYGQAFRDFGADLDTMSSEQGARLLQGLGGKSNVEVAAAIDDWAYVRRVCQGSTSGTERLFKITQLLDPDPVRNRIRSSILARDVAALKDLSGGIDPATQPPQTINLISVWQYVLGYGDRADRTGDAIAFLTRARAYHPNDFQINHNLSFYLNLKGNFDSALSYALAAVAIRPRSQAAWDDCARAQLGLKRIDDAIASYQRMASFGKLAWKYRLQAGYLLSAIKKPEAAQQEYRQVMPAAVKDPEFQAWLSNGRPGIVSPLLLDQFLVEARKLEQATPNDPQLKLTVASLLDVKGESADALATFRAAAKLDAATAANSVQYRRLLLGAARYAEAAEVIRQYLAQQPQAAARDSLLWQQLATLYFHVGDTTRFRETADEMIKRFEKATEPFDLNRTAKTLMLSPDVQKSLAAARAMNDRAVRGNESHPGYRLLVNCQALVRYRAGEMNAAVDLIQNVNKPDPNGREIEGQGYSILAMALHRLGKNDEARSNLAIARSILAKMPVPTEEQPAYSPSWSDWMHADILFREAENLINHETPAAPQRG